MNPVGGAVGADAYDAVVIVPIPTAETVSEELPAFVVVPVDVVVAVPVDVTLVPLVIVAEAFAVVKDQGCVFWVGYAQQSEEEVEKVFPRSWAISASAAAPTARITEYRTLVVSVAG
ncbi:MAG: hypothetical protein NVS4B2_23630 [Chloroflexota bacterium]